MFQCGGRVLKQLGFTKEYIHEGCKLFGSHKNSPVCSACALVRLNQIGCGFLCSLLDSLDNLNQTRFPFSVYPELLSWNFTTAPSSWQPEFKLLPLCCE